MGVPGWQKHQILPVHVRVSGAYPSFAGTRPCFGKGALRGGLSPLQQAPHLTAFIVSTFSVKLPSLYTSISTTFLFSLALLSFVLASVYGTHPHYRKTVFTWPGSAWLCFLFSKHSIMHFIVLLLFISFQTTWNTKGNIFKNVHAGLFHTTKPDHGLPNSTKYSIQLMRYISSLFVKMLFLCEEQT